MTAQIFIYQASIFSEKIYMVSV